MIDSGAEAASKVYCNNRLARLGIWATGRNWELPQHRNTFLCICGSLMFQADPNTAKERLEALNAKLVPPMRESEVANIIRSCLKTRYSWKNTTIAERLEMTPEEAEKFGATGTPRTDLPTAPRTRKYSHQKRDAESKAKRMTMLKRLSQCKAQDMNKSQAAKALGKSREWASVHWNDLDKESEDDNQS